jgi:hypothetical protein
VLTSGVTLSIKPGIDKRLIAVAKLERLELGFSSVAEDLRDFVMDFTVLVER